MSDSGKAVFLSYASQDSEAAKRICEALRAAGVEVWFDQSELVGGDAWDQKIRGQIGSCALFMPVISANTQARLEGYFRREWKQAAGRTHDMADEKAFLLPVVIDDTRDAEAKVPAEFKAVQWTRLPSGETSEKFCARVKKLLADEQGAGSKEHGGQKAEDRERRTPNQEPLTPNQRLGRFWWALPIFGVTMALVLILKEGRKAPPPAIAAPEVVKPAEPAKPGAPQSEAQQLAERAMQLLMTSKGSVGLLAAADLAEKATHFDATDAEVWAVAALVDISCWVSGADRTEQRQEMARTKVMRAKGLAPHSINVRFAEARMLAELELYPDGGAKAESILRELRQENTDKSRGVALTGVLGLALDKQGRGPEAARLLEEAGRTAANWMAAASWSYLKAGMLPEALRAARQETVMERTDGLIMQMVVQGIREDLDAVRELLGQFPESERNDELPASARVEVAYYQREPEQMLAAAKLLPGDYQQSAFLNAPKAASLALAYTLAGRNEAAQLHWKTALAVVDERLATRASDRDLLATRLFILTKLGRQEEADQVHRLLKELRGPQAYFDEAYDLAALGRKEEALVALTEALQRKSNLFGHLNARYDPIFDPLRGDPRFEKLLRDTLPAGAKPFDNPKPEVKK